MTTKEILLLFSALISLASSMKFPKSFNFGASSAAFQVEGAWNTSDKGESIWDRFTHSIPSPISDGNTADVASDSYHLWRRDVEIAEELGINFYRLSISWPRILPDGFHNRISEDGKNYYSNLIDGLLEKGIEPVITMHHYDVPQRIQDLGGWTNPLMSDWFADYARVLYTLYADRVKTWITINEPIIVCDYSYDTGIFAPGITDLEIAPYLCNKHLLMAHAKAWRIYDEEFKPQYHGKVSISNHMVWYQPYSSDDENITELVTEYLNGRYTYPIYSKEGGWPPAIERIMKEASTNEGYQWSRLPPFTEDEVKLIRGTYDYFAVNHYTSRLVRSAEPDEDIEVSFVSGVKELGAVIFSDPSWPCGAASILSIYPEGIRKLMSWIKENYGDVEILITENGYSTNTTTSDLTDDKRINFIESYLEQVLLSINVDHVNVIGYTYWALIDTFEWADGYTYKFGLYEVDFNSTELTRTPRASASYYKEVIKNHELPKHHASDKEDNYIERQGNKSC